MKTCPYCLQPAELLKLGEPGYPYQRSYGPTWTCVRCQAWCGCHPGTENALGRLANAELRAAKQRAHAAFDPLWKRKAERDQIPLSHARKAGYRWLGENLGIPANRTHIGWMDVDQCERVVEICEAAKKRERAT